VPVGFFASKKRFVGFDNALEFGEFAAAWLAEAVQHEPGGFLLYANLFGDLHRGDVLAGRDHQVHGIPPLMQGYVRPFTDRSGANRKVDLALVAAVTPFLRGVMRSVPAQVGQVVPLGPSRLSRHTLVVASSRNI
jgi:hypothetical protein